MFIGRRHHPEQWATALYHLSHLLEAGVSLGVALEDLAREESRAVHRRLWREVCERVTQGHSLSEACAFRPDMFDDVSVAMLRAGESSGTLDEALAELQERHRAREEARRRLQSALTYPMFSAALISGVCAYLLVCVVPIMIEFLVSAGQSPSWHAELLVVLAEATARWGSLVLASGCLAAVVLSASTRRSARCRCLWHRLIARLPGIAGLLLARSIADYSHTLSLLLRRDIALVHGMQLAEGMVANTALRSRLVDVRVRLERGQSLYAAFRETGPWPASTERLIAAGESTGTLVETLQIVARQLQWIAERRLQRVEALSAPTLMCVLGGMLVWIVVSILLPVYEAAFLPVLESGSAAGLH